MNSTNTKRPKREGLPEPPGHDPNNPAHVKSAASAGKGRATRENKANRRRYEEALSKYRKRAARHASLQLFPAFDLQPPQEPEIVAPYPAEFMLEQRRRAREGMKEVARSMHALEMKHARQHLCEILDIAGYDEFLRIVRNVMAGEGYSKCIFRRIGVAHMKVRKRRDTPFTAHMELALAWLEQWEREPPTACELHRACADNTMTRQELQEALWTLITLDFVAGTVMRPCAVCDVPNQATYIAANRKEL